MTSAVSSATWTHNLSGELWVLPGAPQSSLCTLRASQQTLRGAVQSPPKSEHGPLSAEKIVSELTLFIF